MLRVNLVFPIPFPFSELDFIFIPPSPPNLSPAEKKKENGIQYDQENEFSFSKSYRKLLDSLDEKES